MLKMNLSTVHTKLMCNWCSKPVMFFWRLWPSLLRSNQLHSTIVRFSFCRTCDRLTIRMLNVPSFAFLNFWGSKSRLSHEGAFLLRRQFSIWFAYSIVMLVIEQVWISPTQSLRSVVYCQKSGRSSLERRRLRSSQLSWKKMPTKRRNALFESVIFKTRLRKSMTVLVGKTWRSILPSHAYHTSRQYRAVKPRWQYSWIAFTWLYKVGRIRSHGMNSLNS